jgi:hypothetical protein
VRRKRAVPLVAMLIVSCWAAPASAATLTARPDPKDPGYQTIAYYDAAPGEANRVTVTGISDYAIRIADSGAEIRVGDGCRAVDPHTAECASPGSNAAGPNWFLTAVVHTGNGDDEVRSDGVGLDAHGGPGDDLLEVDANVGSSLDGGGGRDHLVGGANSDTLTDGDTSGAANGDVLDGRGDRDTVSYAGRSARVSVDLARLAAGGGEAGEHDTLISIESATGGEGGDALRANRTGSSLDGGPGADRLTGRSGDDFISGRRGDDAISGGAGDDSVDGGAGADRVSGGAGADTVDGGRGPDRLTGGAGDDWLYSGAADCGSGADVVGPASGDLVDRSCELMHFGLRFQAGENADAKGVEARPYPRRRGSRLMFRVRCPATETDGYPSALPLRGAVSVRARDGRLLATGAIPRASRACATADAEDASELPWVRVPARLTATGRRRLAGAHRVRVSVRFTGRNVPPVPWGIVLR